MARAVRFDHYGDRDVLYIADVDVPSPAPGEVVVEVRAAGINPGEASIREGTARPGVPGDLPVRGRQRPRRRGQLGGRGYDGVRRRVTKSWGGPGNAPARPTTSPSRSPS